MAKLQSVKETADLLGISRASLFRLMSQHEIEFIKVGGRTVFDPASVEQFIDEHRVRREAVTVAATA